MIIVCVLSVVAGSLLLTTVARYHTTFQSASWQESIVAAEAGVDLAMNELRKRVVQGPSASFQTGWTTTSPATGKAYPGFGHAFPNGGQPYNLPAQPNLEGNTTTQTRVYLDVPGSDTAPSNFAVANDNSFISQLDNPNLRDADGVDRSRWWYRIRALGIAGVSGPPRPNIDKRDNRLRQISFFNDWRTGQSLASPQAARLVEIVARPLTNFRNALMADKTINLSNQDVLVDSYNSSQGYYSSTTNHGNMGNIATNGQLINASHATVDGDAMTNNGTVTNGDNITGQQSSNFYQELTPLTPGMLNPGWANVKDPGTLTTDATYTASTDATNPTMVHLDGINLPVGGHVVNLAAPAAASSSNGTSTPSYIKVYVQGDILTNGTSSISVANGVNAIIYFTGNVNLQGNGIINGTQLARNLVLNGVQPPANSDGTYPSRTINIATTQDFEGIVYAPNHDLTLALQTVAAGANATTAGNVTYTGTNPQIPFLISRINTTMTQVDALQSDYQTQLAKYDKNGDNGAFMKMQNDQLQINQQQTLISQLAFNVYQLGGTIISLTASQAADHAQGYNGIYGGFVSSTITVAQKTHVHYDETLRTAGPVNHYEIVNWFEDNASRDATGGTEQFWWPSASAR